MSADTSSRSVGRALAGSWIQCNADDLGVRTHDSEKERLVSVTISAGHEQFTLYNDRNAHALSTAARALREAAESLEGIAQECAGQEKMAFATVQAELAGIGDAQDREVYARG